MCLSSVLSELSMPFRKDYTQYGSIIFNKLNSAEINFSEYYFSRDSVSVNVSVSFQRNENLSAL